MDLHTKIPGPNGSNVNHVERTPNVEELVPTHNSAIVQCPWFGGDEASCVIHWSRNCEALPCGWYTRPQH